MMLIDDIVTQSNGAYKHDEAFELEAEFAMGILLANYEKRAYLARQHDVKRKLNEAK